MRFKRYPTSRRRCLPWHSGGGPAVDGVELLAGLFRPYAPTRLHYASVAGGLGLVGTVFDPGDDPWCHELQVAGIRRAVASGGAYYPVEFYAAVPGDARLPAGVYHYDALGHAVEWIRAGDPRPHLERAGTGPAPAGALLLAARCWKSAGKYGNLCYHLTALDVGVALGHVLAYPPAGLRVSFFFLDDHLDDLLGVVPDVESVFAAVLLDGLPRAGAAGPLGGLPPPAVGMAGDRPNRSRVDRVVLDLHVASRITDPSRVAPQLVPSAAEPPAPDPGTGTVRLPPPQFPASEPPDRRSAVAFHPRPIRPAQLATVLAEATRSYPSDLAGTAEGSLPLTLFCVTSAVAGLADGSHRYHPARHALDRCRHLAPGPALRAAVTGLDPALVSNSVSLFLVAAHGPATAAAGERWYRIANMLAGAMLSRICRAATALGLGSRPNLGFHPVAVADLLMLAPDQAPLVHVMVGHPAPRPGCLDLRLTGPVETRGEQVRLTCTATGPPTHRRGAGSET
jgi:SagB-type dehydrogenase family enzyme